MLLAFLALAGACGQSSAQGTAERQATGASDAARAAQRTREAYRETINENVLFLMGGQLGAAYSQIAQDIAVVVNDGNNLRVLPSPSISFSRPPTVPAARR